MFKTSKLTLVLVLLQAASLFGAENNEASEDYGLYPGSLKDQPRNGGQSTGSETMTIEEVEHMIRQAMEEERYLVLTDPELKSLIKVKIEEFLNIKRECIKTEGYYFDYGVPDCKSCLRENCKEDQLCQTECRDFLGRRELKQENEENAREIEAMKSDIRDLKTNKNGETDQTWWIVLAIAIGIVAVLTGISIYMVVTRTGMTNTERLTKPFHPLADLQDMRRLHEFGGAGNEEGAGGNQQP